LAYLHEQNYVKFCLNQLKMWLQPKGLQSDLPDDTCDLRRLHQNHREVNETDDNFYRFNNFNMPYKNEVNYLYIVWYTLYIQLAA